jgi:hypothetical protein
MAASINMDPALAALARLGQPPAQLVAEAKGDVATTRGDLGRVAVGYRPAESERHDRGLFEATAARVYGVAGGRLAQVLASPELSAAWRAWGEGSFAELPARVTLPGPDAPVHPFCGVPRPVLASLPPPAATGATGASVRPGRP